MYIVATISINSYPADKIEEIIRAGADVLRYNFSHGTPEEMTEKISVAKKVIKSLGLEEKIKIFADLPGNKIRLGDMPIKQYPAKKGEIFQFKSAKTTTDCKGFIPVNLSAFATYLEKGQIVTLGDGEIAFEVASIIDDNHITGIALNDGVIPSLKGFNIGRGVDTLDHLTEATRAHIQNLINLKPDWVGFSFVNSAEYIQRTNYLLKEHISDEWRPNVIAKIETPQGVNNVAEISQACDVVLVARGDLGLLCPIDQLGINQKKIIHAAKIAGKQVIVSTQILDSLVDWFVPKRSDILDLTNIILDGADGIMLAKETGVSLTPGRSVATARRIIHTVEQYRQEHNI